MRSFHNLKNWRYEILLILSILCYIFYFSYLGVSRHLSLSSYYYDLGIANQVASNTSRGFFLEMTNHIGVGNISRFAYHFDPFFALLSPLYFIQDGAESLIMAQVVALALGAIPVYLLALLVFSKKKFGSMSPKLFGFFFAFLYLSYFPSQWTLINDVHMVVFATPLLLSSFYFAVTKRFWWSLCFAILALLTKENVALTVAMMGVFFIIKSLIWPSLIRFDINLGQKLSSYTSEVSTLKFGTILLLVGALSFVLIMTIVIPHFRTDLHFATLYYSKDSAENIRRIFQESTFDYFFLTLSPMAFLSLLSPLHLLISAPEWAINLLSKNTNLRSLQFQYTAIISAFVTISAIYGLNNLLSFLYKKVKNFHRILPVILGVVLFSSIVMSLRDGPLPQTFYHIDQKKLSVVKNWQEKLADKNIPVSSSGHLAPHFSNRRYFYNFLFDFAYGVQGENDDDVRARVSRYENAQYVLIQKSEMESKNEVVGYYYHHLQSNPAFQKIFDSEGIEVYHKI